MKWKPVVAALFTLALGVVAVSAQTCLPVVALLEALAANCTDMTRGELCRDGQMASFDGMNSLTVDTAALGQIQASYPDVDPTRFVSLAFVGPLQVQPMVEASAEALPQRVPVEVTLRSGKANVRAQPARSGDPVAQLDNGTQLNATGISRGAAWIRVQLPGQPGQPAWISRGLLVAGYDINLLPVVSANDPIPQYPEFTPMQAFAFASGSPCAGVVLQSGEQPVRLQVNEVDLELHTATVFLQNGGDTLIIHVLEGLLQIQAQETTTVGVAGTLVRVPLDESGAPDAAPEAPIPYDEAGVVWLSGAYAQRAIAPAPPAGSEAVDIALVTPLSGVWKIEYPPPYEYASEEGPQCEAMKVKGGTQLFDVYVATDGSSFSTFNPDITIGAGLRVLPGLYELKDFSFHVLSPTRMTATYDTNPSVNCTSIITITAQWLHSGN